MGELGNDAADGVAGRVRVHVVLVLTERIAHQVRRRRDLRGGVTRVTGRQEG